MKENQFVVDLGSLKLSDDDKKRINTSIQRAVAGELASLSSIASSKVVLVPVNKWPRWPIIWGIIARPLDDIFLDKLKQDLTK